MIRQHGSLKGEPLWTAKKRGLTNTGAVYLQPLNLTPDIAQPIRRVTVFLDQPTRHGRSEIHVLTNLPLKVIAAEVVELYRKR